MTPYVSCRVVPFALFMAFIGGEEILHYLTGKGWATIPSGISLYLYPLRGVTVALFLAFFWKRYDEIRLGDLLRYRETLLSIGVGLLVFVLWVNMPWTLGATGAPGGYDPTTVSDSFTRYCLVAVRVLSASIVVPIMEELFWRSFLLRYIINPDIESVPVGAFTWTSFLIGALFFGLEHHLFYAGVMAGIMYSALLYRTRSIVQCILAHAVTNGVLGGYVLTTHHWSYW